MVRTIVFYALTLALAVAALEWLQYRYVTRTFSTEIYIALLAAAFVALGIWVGRKLTPRPKPVVFERNPNTVKTHVARIYDKLGVGRRILAIEKARGFALIP